MKALQLPFLLFLFLVIPSFILAQNVGIGQPNPVSKLDVKGNLTVGDGFSGSIVAPANGAIFQGNVSIAHTTPDPGTLLTIGDGNYSAKNCVLLRGYDQMILMGIRNPTTPVTLGQTLTSILSRTNPSLQVGDRNQIRLGFAANPGSGGDPRFFSAIEAVVENPENPTKATALRFLTWNQASFGAGEQEWVRLTSLGLLGIGLTSPIEKLHVNGNIRADSVFTTGIGIISDARFKSNIRPMTSALEMINRIEGVKYQLDISSEFSQKHPQEQIGFIAQDLEQICPELVFTDKQGYKYVDYSRLTPILVEAVKSQQQQLEEQAQKMEALQAQLKRMDQQLQALINP